MLENENAIYEILGERLPVRRRRSYLPIWMKCFVWLFMTLGFVSLPFFLAGLFGIKFYFSLYGLETNVANSFMGFFLLSLFLYKFIVAAFLWFEEQLAVLLGIIDASVGILICCDMMFNFPIKLSSGFNIRLEIVVLIPYLMQLVRMRRKWESAPSDKDALDGGLN